MDFSNPCISQNQRNEKQENGPILSEVDANILLAGNNSVKHQGTHRIHRNQRSKDPRGIPRGIYPIHLCSRIQFLLVAAVVRRLFRQAQGRSLSRAWPAVLPPLLRPSRSRSAPLTVIDKFRGIGPTANEFRSEPTDAPPFGTHCSMETVGAVALNRPRRGRAIEGNRPATINRFISADWANSNAQINSPQVSLRG
jgi:hypothetical protein